MGQHVRLRRENATAGAQGVFLAAGAWVQTAEVRYVYDGNLVIQERDQFNVPTVSYTRGLDVSGSLEGAGGIGGLLAFSQLSTLNPQHFYYHADGNGNVTCLMASNQLVVGRYIYDPFGNTLSASGPLAEANLYRFSSKELHPFGLDNTPWPFNGAVCNCEENGMTVCVLIDGDYYTLPPGKCTASGNVYGGNTDVDGYWVDTTFYRIKSGTANACKPKQSCRWNGDPEGPNSPSSRGARLGDAYPDGCGPVYEPPPLVTPPLGPS